MVDSGDADSRSGFAQAFGDALNRYLTENNLTPGEVAKLMGIESAEEGKRKGSSRLYGYFRQGKRTSPRGEIVYLACTKLKGFSFEYRGYRLNAETVDRRDRAPSEVPAEQLVFEGFDCQFNLTRKQRKEGTVAVKVNRPSGRIEVMISLDANAA